jgi:hypothetical protein
MTALIITIVTVAMLVLLSGFYHLDRLIRAEHDHHHEAWVADGRPYFMGSRDTSGFGSHFAWMRVSWIWPWRTPGWVHSSPDYRRRLRLLRIFVFAWNLPFILLGLCVIAFLCLSH